MDALLIQTSIFYGLYFWVEAICKEAETSSSGLQDSETSNTVLNKLVNFVYVRCSVLYHCALMEINIFIVTGLAT